MKMSLIREHPRPPPNFFIPPLHPIPPTKPLPPTNGHLRVRLQRRLHRRRHADALDAASHASGRRLLAPARAAHRPTAARVQRPHARAAHARRHAVGGAGADGRGVVPRVPGGQRRRRERRRGRGAGGHAGRHHHPHPPPATRWQTTTTRTSRTRTAFGVPQPTTAVADNDDTVTVAPLATDAKSPPDTVAPPPRAKKTGLRPRSRRRPGPTPAAATDSYDMRVARMLLGVILVLVARHVVYRVLANVFGIDLWERTVGQVWEASRTARERRARQRPPAGRASAGAATSPPASSDSSSTPSWMASLFQSPFGKSPLGDAAAASSSAEAGVKRARTTGPRGRRGRDGRRAGAPEAADGQDGGDAAGDDGGGSNAGAK